MALLGEPRAADVDGTGTFTMQGVLAGGHGVVADGGGGLVSQPVEFELAEGQVLQLASPLCLQPQGTAPAALTASLVTPPSSPSPGLPATVSVTLETLPAGGAAVGPVAVSPSGFSVLDARPGVFFMSVLAGDPFLEVRHGWLLVTPGGAAVGELVAWRRQDAEEEAASQGSSSAHSSTTSWPSASSSSSSSPSSSSSASPASASVSSSAGASSSALPSSAAGASSPGASTSQASSSTASTASQGTASSGVGGGSFTCGGTELYVDNVRGSDSNDGCTGTAPLATLGVAIFRLNNAGAGPYTLHVCDSGTPYVEQTLNITTAVTVEGSDACTGEDWPAGGLAVVGPPAAGALTAGSTNVDVTLSHVKLVGPQVANAVTLFAYGGTLTLTNAEVDAGGSHAVESTTGAPWALTWWPVRSCCWTRGAACAGARAA